MLSHQYQYVLYLLTSSSLNIFISLIHGFLTLLVLIYYEMINL